MIKNVAEITADEVVESFGEHYINEGQNMSNLHMLPMQEYGTQSAGTVIETDQTVLREANVEVEEILQQYQDEFTSKGGMTFKPVMIPLYNVKIDVAFVPKKLQKSWLGFLTNNDKTPENYPFIQWVVEQYLMKRSKHDLETKGIYKGVYEAPEDGVAGSADNVMDGIEKLLVDLEAAGDLDFIDTGALSTTPATFVTQIEDFIKSIPEEYRYNYALELNMNRTLRDRFKQGMREKYNIQYLQTNNLLQLMDYENVTVMGRASMQNKNRIWTTPKFNLLLPVKGFDNINGFDVQKVDRKVKFLTDFWVGAGFVQPQIVFANELT